MTRGTFQARLRTTAGRPSSVVNRTTGIPQTVLRQNLEGPIQMLLVNPTNGAHIQGMLPKDWMISGWAILGAAGAGTFQIDLPAYAGLPAVNLVAAATAATSQTAKAATAAGTYVSYAKDRPLQITTTGVTGAFRVALFGFPLDDGTDEMN